MSYQTELIAFKPTYQSIMRFMQGRKKFWKPLNQTEVAVCVHFAGQYYDGRGLTREHHTQLQKANTDFRAMQTRCPAITGCDLTQNNPFTVQLLEEQWASISASHTA